MVRIIRGKYIYAKKACKNLDNLDNLPYIKYQSITDILRVSLKNRDCQYLRFLATTTFFAYSPLFQGQGESHYRFLDAASPYCDDALLILAHDENASHP